MDMWVLTCVPVNRDSKMIRSVGDHLGKRKGTFSCRMEEFTSLSQSSMFSKACPDLAWKELKVRLVSDLFWGQLLDTATRWDMCKAASFPGLCAWSAHAWMQIFILWSRSDLVIDPQTHWEIQPYQLGTEDTDSAAMRCSLPHEVFPCSSSSVFVPVLES